MKKVLVFGLMLLFIRIFTIPSVIPSEIVSKNIIMVDDEPGDADYTSIIDALNHSSPGDTIQVHSGIYYEHGITITKERISLIGIPLEIGIGNDTGKPFINGQGLDEVIIIKACDVIITGFKMENNGGEIACGIIGIWKYADHCVISDNDLSRSVMGCIGCSANYSRIENNTISQSSIRQGIVLGGYHNTISNNTISDVSIGIDLWNAFFSTVNGNKITKCSEFGIYIAGGAFNTLTYNDIEKNPIGLYLEQSIWNRIKKNSFINNTHQVGFYQGLGFTAGNCWIQNYWGHPRLLPYPIHGTVFIIIPWVQFDWHPAQQPYNISGF